MPVTATVDFMTPADDTGACTVLLHPDIMRDCDVKTDDVVRLSTKRGLHALARVAGINPAGAVGTARLDRQVQRTLRAAPQEQIQVDRADPPPAQRILLMPVAAVWGYQPFFLSHIKRVLSAARAPVS